MAGSGVATRSRAVMLVARWVCRYPRLISAAGARPRQFLLVQHIRARFATRTIWCVGGMDSKVAWARQAAMTSATRRARWAVHSSPYHSGAGEQPLQSVPARATRVQCSTISVRSAGVMGRMVVSVPARRTTLAINPTNSATISQRCRWARVAPCARSSLAWRTPVWCSTPPR